MERTRDTDLLPSASPPLFLFLFLSLFLCGGDCDCDCDAERPGGLPGERNCDKKPEEVEEDVLPDPLRYFGFALTEVTAL